MADCPHCKKMRDRIEALELALGLNDEIAPQLGLTPKEAELFGMLLRRGRLGTERVMAALYGHLPAPPDSNVVRVMLSRIRRKVAPHGIVILSRWGQGWVPDAASKRRYFELVELWEAAFGQRPVSAWAKADDGSAVIGAQP